MTVLIDPKMLSSYYSGESLSITIGIDLDMYWWSISIPWPFTMWSSINAWYSALFGRFRIRLKGRRCFTSIQKHNAGLCCQCVELLQLYQALFPKTNNYYLIFFFTASFVFLCVQHLKGEIFIFIFKYPKKHNSICVRNYYIYTRNQKYCSTWYKSSMNLISLG